MKAQIQPGWLVSLLNRWVRRNLAIESNGLGFPAIAPGFNERTGTAYDHHPLCDFCANDYADLERSMRSLNDHSQALYVTILMYYKPWTIVALTADGHPFGNSTYYKRLHTAHAWLAQDLGERKNN